MANEETGDEVPYVCPGCHAVGEPCLPGCIDAELEQEREDERDRYYEYGPWSSEGDDDESRAVSAT